ncbi:hypothetical protein V8G54_007423 [Vigna mungo]|uniref:Uncharacterized protein n=1 Tax=Vigna mungo TaxID=3915 RepID=A0AAQ3S8Y2_VIGMU
MNVSMRENCNWRKPIPPRGKTVSVWRCHNNDILFATAKLRLLHSEFSMTLSRRPFTIILGFKLGFLSLFLICDDLGFRVSKRVSLQCLVILGVVMKKKSFR